ncbi:MAG: SDR family oxidoreductase [Deltaproteobacteria bacterium]|nr:SDR family oxidoreductase [Deltaproteobacteria bacterium]
MGKSYFDLSGKVALITGGNGGIGLGMAEALAEAGSDRCIWGRNEKKNEAAEKKLKSYGHRVLVLKCDVSDEKQVEKCFSETVKILGKVTTCFANAGIGGDIPFQEMTIEEWRRIFSVNMEGVFFTFRAAIRHMIENKIKGSLVATSSSSAISGAPRSAHYASSKGGLLSLIRTLAVGYARYGIRDNAIIPGWIETDMTAEIFANEKFKDTVLRRIPQRRWGVPADFGPAAVYFASDASAYHSGDEFIIDGAYFRF